jgi:hypothetical protein
MKTIYIVILVIVVEACGLFGLFSAENNKLKAENSTLKHQLNYQKDKNEELQWLIAKMDLLMAGKTAEEIFKSEEVHAEPEKQEEDDTIYLD